MDYTLMTYQGTEIIFCYFLLSLKNMAKLDYGLCITNLQLFPLLLPAHQNSPAAGTRASPPTSQGPHQDAPHRRKEHLDDVRKPGRRDPLTTRPHLRWDLDEENEKENQNPNLHQEDQQENEEYTQSYLQSLLKKWEADIDRFRDMVYRDLEGLKQKLGIQMSS
ncbi:E4 [Papillomavirus JL74]|uniref:E4 n=1 Tax=Papillomavirus JL74 TaxID=1846251 RepID=A0A172PZE3_9PAPI|nr:E4 [Papillomavirus JL74]